FHPGGKLGRRLLRVENAMHGGDAAPVVNLTTPMPEVIHEMSSKRLGMTCVVDRERRLAGVVTDGDLRRLMSRTPNVLALTKADAYERIIQQAGLGDAEVAYMGDDLLDLPVLARVGLSATPADGAPEVKARVHWISAANGGRGAARELVELVLRAQGRWDAVVQQYSGA